ncbi:MAG TPA: AAA family ATPase [Acidimicrobiales bacterium]|nr:AAA family ATPase [Acidimicrobiales bacterium]
MTDAASRVMAEVEPDFSVAGADSAQVPPRPGVPLIWGNEVQPRALRWLWPGRIAAGKITIFEGDPGLGKSLVAEDLAARLTRGASLPGCEDEEPPRRVLIASAEDTVDDVILPRLVAAGVDRRLVAFHRLARDPDTGKVVPLTIPRDLDRLAATVVDNDIPFVVLDPLVAFLGEEIRSHVDASVRHAMGPLSVMAEETGAAVAGLRHLNKSTSEDNPIYRGGGSIAFSAAARSVLLFARHRDDPSLHVVAQVKTNLSPPGAASSLGYRIEASPSPYGDQPTVCWLAEPLGISAAELLRRGGRDEAPKRSEAEDFLLEVLADGAVAVEEIRELAQSAGLSWRTVERAKGSAQVSVERRRDGSGKTLGWSWRLPVEPVDEVF